MRKPIIVFALVMVLAPLPTFIPWLYDIWSNAGNSFWYAAAPGKFPTTEYASVLDAAPWFMNGSATNLDETATDGVNSKEDWGCPGLRDERILLTKLFYH